MSIENEENASIFCPKKGYGCSDICLKMVSRNLFQDLRAADDAGPTTCNVCALNLPCDWAVLSGWNLGKTVSIGVDNQFQSIRYIQLVED
jgi:hypothetical protein